MPIVEPEVLMDGAHSIERCEEVTNLVLQTVFRELFEHKVLLEGMVLKPNMVIAGKKAAHRAGPEVVAEATLRTLRRHVPPAVPGIAFLSGGQSSQEATLHLGLMNKLGPQPWTLTFSYGRALQDDALKAWGGAAANYAAGQKAFAKRARLNGLAAAGRLHRRDGKSGRLREPPPRPRDQLRPRARGLRRVAADTVVDVRDVHYAVGGRPIFAGLDLSVRRGRITAIMGPTGTGKTTLLRLITAQISAERGQVLASSAPNLATQDSREIYALRRRMGMLFQNGALLTRSRRVRERRLPGARAHRPARSR